MRRRWRRAAIAGAVGVLGCAALVPAAQAQSQDAHVLLLSVDGLHQSDLAWYVAKHPDSALAALAHKGTEYTHAQTTNPSDSFPGMVAQVTGGGPATTGVYYDDSYNHSLLPAGTTSCGGAAAGAEADYTEDLDKNKDSIDAGQGLPGLPGGVLAMTGKPRTLITPAALPVDPKTCRPVYPYQYLKVNTVFEVAHQAGLRTAWSDKHPAYDILNGPSGAGIDDLFTPEINSNAPAGGDWTTDNASTRTYDGYKVRAVLNEIDGYDHSGTTRAGTPAVFGMNFQTVSTAQKLPASDGLQGGYLADGTPGPLLTNALDWIDQQVGAMTAELRKQGLAGKTSVILSAKHGQSPIQPSALTRIDDGPLIDGLNTAWKAAHGGSDLVAHAVDDDAMLLWLNDRSPMATTFAKDYLLAQSGTGNGIDGKPKPFVHSGLQTACAGTGSAHYFGAAAGDPRVPDLVGVVQYGVVYTGGTKKIAEHGGAAPDDRDVPLVVSGPQEGHDVVADGVQTTQIAPTILALLHLDPAALQAVGIDHTQVLPGTR